MIRPLIAVLLILPSIVEAGVIVGDKEWRQLTETVDLSWNQVATVCNSATGACSGTVDTVNFDGWTWASLDDVNSLFSHFVPVTLGPGPDTYFEDDSSWGPLFFTFFNPTQIVPSTVIRVYGNTRTESPFDSDFAYLGFLTDSDLETNADSAFTAGVRDKTISQLETGVWLYKAAPVPEPGAFTLLLFGLVCLVYSRKREIIN